MRLTKLLRNEGDLTDSKYQRFIKKYPFIVVVYSTDDVIELWPDAPESKERSVQLIKERSVQLIKELRKIRKYEKQHGIKPAEGFIFMENVESNDPQKPNHWPPHLKPLRKQTSSLVEAHLANKFNINLSTI